MEMGICKINIIFAPNKTATTQQWQAVITMMAIMKILMWVGGGGNSQT